VPDVPDVASDAAPDVAPDIAPPPDPGSWTQCATDADCEGAVGPGSVCNLAFPGGQCQGCDPLDVVACSGLVNDGNTLTCKETMPPVCLFDCPCPPWLRCLESDNLCVLRTCQSDGECLPFVCRPLSDGGTSYCLSST
jgi:hypothetical protein